MGRMVVGACFLVFVHSFDRSFGNSAHTPTQLSEEQERDEDGPRVRKHESKETTNGGGSERDGEREILLSKGTTTNQ